MGIKSLVWRQLIMILFIVVVEKLSRTLGWLGLFLERGRGGGGGGGGGGLLSGEGGGGCELPEFAYLNYLNLLTCSSIQYIMHVAVW